MQFDHEKLDVWRVALDFLVYAEELATLLTPSRYYMAEQLRRAAFSVCLNIAEGAGEFSKAEKQRFYRFARRSAVECVAVVRCCQRLDTKTPDTTEEGLEKAARVIAMLTVLTMPAARKPTLAPKN